VQISYFSLFLILVFCTIFFHKKKYRVDYIGTIAVILILSVHIIFVFLEWIPPFHFADSKYFYDGGLYLSNNVTSMDTLISSLLAYTHAIKYYGYFTYNYLSIHGVDGEIFHSINISITQSMMFLIFFMFYLKKTKNDITSAVIVIPIFCFMLTQNFRDGILSLIIFVLFYSLFKRNIIPLILSFILLAFFRYEFIYIFMMAISLSIFVYKFKRSNIIVLLMVGFAILAIPLVVGHARMDIINMVVIPVAFVGKSMPQIFAEFFAGDSYYQLYFTSYITYCFLTVSMMAVTVVIISYFITSEKNLSSPGSMGKITINSVILSYLLSLILYSYINDGFNLRVKSVFFPSIVGIISIVYGSSVLSQFLKNKYSLLIYSFLLLITIIINLRWVLK